MSEMKNSGIEWIRDIPIHWRVMPNKYLMHKVKELNPVYNGEDILSLSMNGVMVRDLDAGGKMPASFDGYQRVKAGNLLMCLFDIDVTPRCIGLIKQDGITSPAYSQFVLNNIADPAYYCYYYTMLDNDKTLLHLAKNLRHSLTEDQLGATPTIVPPLDEQRLIASYLDVKCTQIDELIESIRKQIAVLEQFKRSVITEIVTKGMRGAVLKESGIPWVSQIPNNWEVMPNKYLMHKTKKICSVYSGEDILSLTMGGVVVRDLDAGGKMPASFDGYQFIEPGNLLMCLFDIDVTPRCIGLITQSGITSPAYSQFVLHNGTYPSYYYYYYLMLDFTKELLHLAKNLRHSLTEDQFGAIPTVFPPYDEQREIADFLDLKCAETDTIITEKMKQVQILEEYKKAVIFEFVTGKKSVKELM